MPVARATLVELARVFGWLGATSFGGPAAHLAIMRRELVERRRWLDEGRFLDLVSAANLIPGPTSTEVVMHVGYTRGGAAGLWIAGLAFITPAVLLTFGFAVLYQRYGSVPEAGAALGGVKPVVVALVLHALVALGRGVMGSWTARGLAVVAFCALALGVGEIEVLLAAGLLQVLVRRGVRSVGLAPAVLPAAAATGGVGAGALFLSFLKIGCLLFGSGYVLFAFLQAELVERQGWLTQDQLVDAIAVGQLTPGPLFSSATFVGYVLGGVPGAVAATVGIFLPAFLLVGLTGPRLAWLRQSAAVAPFLDGVNVASLALMAWVTVQLGRAAFADLRSLVLGIAALVVVTRTRLNSAWIILAGAAVGVLWVG